MKDQQGDVEDVDVPDLTPPVPVPDGVRGLLCALAYGWTPVPMKFGRVEQFRCGGVDLSDSVQDLVLHNNRLKVTVGGDGLAGLMPFPMDAQLDGMLDGGVRLHGDMILRINRSMSVSQEFGMREVVTIEAGTWTVAEGDAPSLWVGVVEGMGEINVSGNLIIERRAADWPFAGHRRHFALFGRYKYYFVQHRSSDRSGIAWHLVVDTSGTGMPEMEAVGRDFLVLEFVLGRQLCMPMLVGLDLSRRTVACTIGFDRRRHLEKYSFPPVPLERDNDKWIDVSWPSLFFERISAAWRQLPHSDKSYWLALDMYLDAMRMHLDFDYMHLQIGLEAFAFWLLKQRGQGDPLDVKSKDAWEAWVRENKESIRVHAVEGREDALVMKVKGACRLASGNVVPSAFLAYGLNLTKNLRGELRGRDIVVHQGLMAPNGYDTVADLRRVALVRTMLVALVGLAAGYRGAINGWEVGGLGYPIEQQEWWEVAESDRTFAGRRFIAEECVSSS
ncbi:hypothetical protein [Sorangium sp. So ce128]|uniref:hypothetical protein n=1 Tax=Sorangium sp. So ce128 TaxID=3133281 RepID=UPI003F5D6C04